MKVLHETQQEQKRAKISLCAPAPHLHAPPPDPPVPPRLWDANTQANHVRVLRGMHLISHASGGSWWGGKNKRCQASPSPPPPPPPPPSTPPPSSGGLLVTGRYVDSLTKIPPPSSRRPPAVPRPRHFQHCGDESLKKRKKKSWTFLASDVSCVLVLIVVLIGNGWS